MFEFKDQVEDEFISYDEFCNGYENSTINDMDEFTIVEDYINNNDDFESRLKTYLSIPISNVKINTVAWHIIAAILGLNDHSLDSLVVGELLEKIFKENERVNNEFILCGRGVASERIGNKITFVYKKAIENVLSESNIGQRLHPSFVSVFKDNIRKKKINEYIIGTFYGSLRKTSWLSCMKIKGAKTHGKLPSVFFYVY